MSARLREHERTLVELHSLEAARSETGVGYTLGPDGGEGFLGIVVA